MFSTITATVKLVDPLQKLLPAQSPVLSRHRCCQSCCPPCRANAAAPDVAPPLLPALLRQRCCPRCRANDAIRAVAPPLLPAQSIVLSRQRAGIGLYPKGIKVLTLFPGFGGAEVALLKVGIKLNVVVSVEIEEGSRRCRQTWRAVTNQSGCLDLDFHDVQDLTKLVDNDQPLDFLDGGD
jgi:hypothetical protein